MTPRLVNRISILLCCVGFFIAGTLTLSEFSDKDVPCGGGSGCAIVAASPGSHLFGIPVALFGAVGYLALLASTVAFAAGRRHVFGFWLSAVGISVSAGLTAYALLKLHTACSWCLGSAITMGLLFCCQWRLRRVVSTFDSPSLILAPVLFIASSGAILFESSHLHQSSDLRVTRALAQLIPPSELITADSHVLGAAGAPLTIVEFADFSCPACKTLFPRLHNLIDHHPGQVRLVFHNLPLGSLPGHENSVLAAILSEEAAQKGRFWEFAEDLYSHDLLDSRDYRSMLAKYGSGFDERLAGQQVEKDRKLASRLRIGQTPTFLLISPESPVKVATSKDLVEALTHTSLDRS